MHATGSQESQDEESSHERRRAPSPGLPDIEVPSSQPPKRKRKKKKPETKKRSTALATFPGAIMSSPDLMVEPEDENSMDHTLTSEESEALELKQRDISDEMAKHKARRASHAINPGAFSVVESENGKRLEKTGRRRTSKISKLPFSSSNINNEAPSPYGDLEGDGVFREDFQPDQRKSSHALTPRTSQSSISIDDSMEDPDVESQEYPSRSLEFSRLGQTDERQRSTLGRSIHDASVQNFEDWERSQTQQTIEPESFRKKTNIVKKGCLLMLVLLSLTFFLAGMVMILKAGEEPSSPEEQEVGAQEDPRSAHLRKCVETDAESTSFSERYTSMRWKLLSTLKREELFAVDEVGSPQRRALCWLADLDEIENFVDANDFNVWRQRYSMAVFYFSLVDADIPEGLARSNWVTSEHECNWRGVWCTDDFKQQVTRLIVSNEYLRGTLPVEITLLHDLELLMLSRNRITGTLPTEFERLLELGVLSLESNELTGSLPSQIANMKSLRVLSISDNNIVGEIPQTIGQCTQLEELLLSGNFMEGEVPSTIGLLTNLNQLVLAPGRLTGKIPTEVGLMQALEILDLGRNSLTGSIPSEIVNLSNLQTLDLSNNGLSGTIPTEICHLSCLSDMSLQSNFLEGSISSAIEMLEKIETLVLANNDLSGNVPTEVGNLTLLENLYLNGNKFSGELPSEIGLLQNLVTFVVSGSGLSGTVPSSLGDLKMAERMVLSDNYFIGTIHNKICRLRQHGKLEELEADCAGDEPSVFCPDDCCTRCG